MNAVSPLTVSVIVPVFNGEQHLGRCLDALRASQVPPLEILVVDDGSTDRSAAIARSSGAEVLAMEARSGPARARNRGAASARGDILHFVDADVAVHPDTVGRIMGAFASAPDLQALMGSYDDVPDDRSLISLYKNLLHHYVHQHGRRRAMTFWAGCGAVRRPVYLRLGGMNEAYNRPSIEDIELGYRLYRAGLACELRPEIQATHLKRWTLLSLIRTDVFCRAAPWTELMIDAGIYPDDLNFSYSHKAGTVLALAIPLVLVAAMSQPLTLVVAFGLLLAFAWLNRDLYRLFHARGGLRLGLAALPLHLLYAINCAVGFGIGWLRYLRRKLSGRHPVFLSSLQTSGHPCAASPALEQSDKAK